MYIAFRIYFISRRSICAAFGTAPPPASEGTASAPRYVATGPVGRGSRPGPTRWVKDLCQSHQVEASHEEVVTVPGESTSPRTWKVRCPTRFVRGQELVQARIARIHCRQYFWQHGFHARPNSRPKVFLLRDRVCE